MRERIARRGENAAGPGSPRGRWRAGRSGATGAACVAMWPSVASWGQEWGACAHPRQGASLRDAALRAFPKLAEWGPSTFWWVAKILDSLTMVEICFVFLLQNPADVQRAAERTMPRVPAPAMFDLGREAEGPIVWAGAAPAPAALSGSTKK